jgi:hypothetical protein
VRGGGPPSRPYQRHAPGMASVASVNDVLEGRVALEIDVSIGFC